MRAKLFRKVGWPVLAVMLISIAPLFGDSFNFNFENVSSSLVYNGSAQRITSGNVISGLASGQLTDNTPNFSIDGGEAGSIVLADRIYTSFFDVTFSFLLNGTSTYDGDGITLSLFGGSSPNVVGKCCSGLGFANIVPYGVPAFSVEFDTFGNGTTDNQNEGGTGCVDPVYNVIAPCPTDSPAPHVAVTLGSQGVFSSLRDQASYQTSLLGQKHTAHVQLFGTALNIWLDNNLIIPNFYVQPAFIPSLGYIGFTGSTDGATDYQVVDDINITAKAVPEPPTLFLLLLGILSVTAFIPSSSGLQSLLIAVRVQSRKPDRRSNP